jgi:hypothetical protein
VISQYHPPAGNPARQAEVRMEQSVEVEAERKAVEAMEASVLDAARQVAEEEMRQTHFL